MWAEGGGAGGAEGCHQLLCRPTTDRQFKDEETGGERKEQSLAERLRRRRRWFVPPVRLPRDSGLQSDASQAKRRSTKDEPTAVSDLRRTSWRPSSR